MIELSDCVLRVEEICRVSTPNVDPAAERKRL
jgi:hypothetical protein